MGAASASTVEAVPELEFADGAFGVGLAVSGGSDTGRRAAPSARASGLWDRPGVCRLGWDERRHSESLELLIDAAAGVALISG